MYLSRISSACIATISTNPQNVDLDYTANIVMTINKYLSANFTFQAIYDDDAAKAFQIREVLGLGVNYKF